jgi:hypothetical protein
VSGLARKYVAAIVGEDWQRSNPFWDHGMKLAKERNGNTSVLAE